MNISEEVYKELEQYTDQWKDGRIIQHDDLRDLLLLYCYGEKVFSQFGLGLCGWVCRQRNGETLLTVKVVDSGTPLVGYITSATPTGCVSKLFDLMERERIVWAKDRYPWT